LEIYLEKHNDIITYVLLLQAVQQVVTNLQIGHIELRNEDSFDIQRYVHERKVEKIIVPLDGEIADVKNNFVKVNSKARVDG
jgi:ERCC4-related helicase